MFLNHGFVELNSWIETKFIEAICSSKFQHREGIEQHKKTVHINTGYLQF